MANERGRNKKKREKKRIERLKRLLGIDLCACGGGHKLQCRGLCKKRHTNSKTKQIECHEIYQIDRSIIKTGDSRKPKRTWKYGNQQDENDHKTTKQHRREKRERDRLE
ncbi:MAG: hypothetical protein V3W20_09355 [Candidatus Neomarinimicrobiota bacterium]